MSCMYIRTKEKSGKPIFGVRGGAYIREEKHFLQFAVYQIPFCFFFSSINHVFSHFSLRARWERCSELTINKDTRIRKVNIKVKNKDTVDVVLATLSLTLGTLHFLLQYFYCWPWSVNCWLGLLFVNLMLCACWNQFGQTFHLWRN